MQISEFVTLLLKISLTGTVLSVIVLLVIQILKNKLSESCKLWIWLIPILNFSFSLSFMGKLLSDRNMVKLLWLDNLRFQTIENENLYLHTSVIHDLNSSGTLILNDEIWNILVLLWGGGVIFLLLRWFCYNKNGIRILKENMVPIVNNEILHLYHNLCLSLKVNNVPALFSSSLVSTPLLIGVKDTAIVIPVAYKERVKDLEYVLRHELTHYKRKDLWIRTVVHLVSFIHWFNPLALIARKEVEKRLELSCDELVVKEFDTQKKEEYGLAILNGVQMHFQYSIVEGLAFSKRGSILKERLVIIMKQNKGNHMMFFIPAFAILLVFSLYTSIGFADDASVEGITHKVNLSTESSNIERRLLIDQTNDMVVIEAPENMFLTDSYNLKESAQDVFDAILEKGLKNSDWYLYSAEISVPNDRLSDWLESDQFFILLQNELIEKDKFVFVLQREESIDFDEGLCKFTFKKAV